MRKKTEREPRESALGRGWRVESDAADSVVSSAASSVEGASVEGASANSSLAAEPASSQDDTGSANVSVDEDAPAVSNGALVVLGVFGGLYLLYAWGWFIVAQAYSSVNAWAAAGSGSVGGVLQQIVFWAAPLGPVLWFSIALLLSRGGRTKRLAIMLLVGAVVLLPLPMLIARGS